MRITIFGAGYVGLVTAACLSDMGNDVLCVDKDHEKISDLSNGKVQIYEQGLSSLVNKNLNKNLQFTSDETAAINFSSVFFVCVNTPTTTTGHSDISNVVNVVQTIVNYAKDDKIIVIKSTVPVGTSDLLKQIANTAQTCSRISIVSNPEFLQEGHAIDNFYFPNRIILGGDTQDVLSVIKLIFQKSVKNVPVIIETDNATAEIIKYACNTFLATKISFINEMAEICERCRANIRVISYAMGLDPRIGPDFLQAGTGFGGSCFPKDIRSFISVEKSMGIHNSIIEAALLVNEQIIPRLVNKIEAILNGIAGQKICLLGLTFKSGTNDIRDSQALKLLKLLTSGGAHVKVFDPQMHSFLPYLRANCPEAAPADSVYSAVEDCSLVVIMTAWPEFRSIDFLELKKRMNSPIIVDPNNVLSGRKEELDYNNICYIGTAIDASQMVNAYENINKV